MTSATDERIARNTRTYLAHRQASQEALADYLGLDPSSLSKALRGKRKWSAREVEGLAGFLTVDIGVLFREPDANLRSRWFASSPRSVTKISLGLTQS